MRAAVVRCKRPFCSPPSAGTDDGSGDEHLFDGIRFFLIGFESDIPTPHTRISPSLPVCLRVYNDWLGSSHRPISSNGVHVQYRSEMERRGGADARMSGNGCTHVVVSNLFYVSWMCKLVNP